MTSRIARLSDGETIPALGQGTYRMGDDPDARRGEIAALRLGVELGMGLIDTAEIYGDGASEDLVGEAFAGRREDIFLVTKVSPQNAGRLLLAAHCAASLKRLRTDRIDLYLVHWRGGPALGEMAEGMEALKAAGKIRHWGVSNYDVGDMDALVAAGGAGCGSNQIFYNLEVRGPEYDLLPWTAARSMPLMAYSPVGQGRLLGAPALIQMAARQGVAPATLALAWILTRPNVIAIPKASNPDHVRANAAAADLILSPDELAALDAAFPPPAHKIPLKLI